MLLLVEENIILNNMEILKLLIIILQLKMVGLIKITMFGGVMKILNYLNMQKMS